MKKLNLVRQIQSLTGETIPLFDLYSRTDGLKLEKWNSIPKKQRHLRDRVEVVLEKKIDGGWL